MTIELGLVERALRRGSGKFTLVGVEVVTSGVDDTLAVDQQQAVWVSAKRIEQAH